jgi:hypothetical protein
MELGERGDVQLQVPPTKLSAVTSPAVVGMSAPTEVRLEFLTVMLPASSLMGPAMAGATRASMAKPRILAKIMVGDCKMVV